MKCPKCGSTNITEEEKKNGFYFCLSCYFKWKDNYKQPDPTTAEMVLWLLENQPIIFVVHIKSWIEKGLIGNEVHEAIRAAYAEAQKQEVTE